MNHNIFIGIILAYILGVLHGCKAFGELTFPVVLVCIFILGFWAGVAK
jgi:hypothetical protein